MFVRLPFKIFLLILACIAGGVLWQQAQLSVLALSRINPVPEIESLIAEKRYAEAADYLGFSWIMTMSVRIQRLRRSMLKSKRCVIAFLPGKQARRGIDRRHQR